MQSLLFKESPILGYSNILLIFISYFLGYKTFSFAFIILFIFLLLFYRYQPINKIFPDNVIISPTEGEITDITQDNNYYYISIFLSPFNEHTQVYPVNGKVLETVYDLTGQYNIATDKDKTRHNEKVIHYLQMHNNAIIKLTQIAGVMVRRISYNKNKYIISAGEYLGMIKFGSRVDLRIPKNDFYDNIIKFNNVYEGKKINKGELLGLYS